MRFLCHLNKLIIILMSARLKDVILQVNSGEKIMFIICYRFHLLRYHYWGFILKNCYMLDNIGTIFRFFQATYCDTVFVFACWSFSLLGNYNSMYNYYRKHIFFLQSWGHIRTHHCYFFLMFLLVSSIYRGKHDSHARLCNFLRKEFWVAPIVLFAWINVAQVFSILVIVGIC